MKIPSKHLVSKKIKGAIIQFTLDKLSGAYTEYKLHDYVWDTLSGEDWYDAVCENDEMTSFVNDEMGKNADMVCLHLKALL